MKPVMDGGVRGMSVSGGIYELYIEPTSKCNLNCKMCSRKKWADELSGDMELAAFDRVINEMPRSVKRIFFGGIGEPLHHPEIIYMLRRAKETGRRVEMITNGTLLSGEMSEKIVDAGLDILWVSLDSMEAEKYESIREGAAFGNVMENIRVFNEKSFPTNWHHLLLDKARTKLGVAFVLMKENLDQFKTLLKRARELGIAEIKATHLIPYDEAHAEQICYERILGMGMYGEPRKISVRVDMPLLDIEDIERQNMLPVFTNGLQSFSFMSGNVSRRENYCRFVQEGIAFVRWDGEICPCMALLHKNTVFQQGAERNVLPCGFGNIKNQGIDEIWESEEYSSFRKRVIDFEFSPCTQCGLCDLFETNEKDCFGNPFPTCGGCLWAQGLIQCP